MRRFTLLFLVSSAVFVVVACSKTQAPPPSSFRPTSTIKDLMDSMVDPSADALWESVATIVSAAGTEERQPKTPEEWANVRRRAITLIEATNLLIMEGRHVAKPGEKAENEEVELGPEEIEKLINEDRTTWIKNAYALNDATMIALKAIDAKSASGLLDAGEGIDTACENCHLKYWYPLSKQAEKAKEGAGSVKK
ncbi:MAG: hypothetical protein ABJA98_35685 [Acidobacteriota bacterium]